MGRDSRIWSDAERFHVQFGTKSSSWENSSWKLVQVEVCPLFHCVLLERWQGCNLPPLGFQYALNIVSSSIECYYTSLIRVEKLIRLMSLNFLWFYLCAFLSQKPIENLKSNLYSSLDNSALVSWFYCNYVGDFVSFAWHFCSFLIDPDTSVPHVTHSIVGQRQ